MTERGLRTIQILCATLVFLSFVFKQDLGPWAWGALPLGLVVIGIGAWRMP